jgi:hypothetical protein
LATFDLKVQTGQGCYAGEIEKFNQSESDTVKRVNWLWEWWPKRNSETFVTCVGPRTYAAYRPLDVSVLGVLVSLGLIGLALRRR